MGAGGSFPPARPRSSNQSDEGLFCRLTGFRGRILFLIRRRGGWVLWVWGKTGRTGRFFTALFEDFFGSLLVIMVALFIIVMLISFNF